MSGDPYYDKEDNVPDTPETVIQNYQAQAESLNGLVQKTANQLNEAEQNLGWLYQQAEAGGNQDAMVAVNSTWAITQEMAARITLFDAARLSSVAMMKRMAEYTEAVNGRLVGLETAIENGDEHDPRLRDFAETVREDEREYAAEMMWDDTMEVAYENVFVEIHEGIREATGCTEWAVVHRLTDLLTGNSEPSEEQKHLLTELVETLREKAQVKS